MVKKKNAAGLRERVFRCDKLPTHMNAGKQQKLKTMLVEWRECASEMATLMWNDFFKNGAFDPFFDPATSHRRKGIDVRSGLLRQIAGYFNVEPTAFEKKRLPEMISGLNDPLAEMKSCLGAAQVQMLRGQVLGTLNSYLSNRQNDFTKTVYGSTIPAAQRHALFIVNRAKAWFDLNRPLLRDGERIDLTDRLLARKIMSRIMSRNRFPDFSRIGMVVDQRIASLSPSDSANSFDMWLKLRVSRGTSGAIHIPVNGYRYFNERSGDKSKSLQIIEDRETGAVSIGVVTDVTEAFAQSREAYKTNPLHELALDFGLTTMFATNEGDLLGRGFLTKLEALDHTIAGIARHVQRGGGKPRSSQRYRKHVARARGFITTEMNRVINRLIVTHKPTKLFLERLDFSSPALSKRLNRILQNCGRAVLRTKLAAISQQFGIESTEVVSAYTSQTCSCCGYVDKRNRKTQSEFSCLWCGNSLHADVNASRNIRSDRFRSLPALRPGFRKTVLQLLVAGHLERNTRRTGSPADPRTDNPYFIDYQNEVRCLPCDAKAPLGKARQVDLTT